MVFHTSEALSAIFMPKIEYCTTLLTEPVCKQVDEERFLFLMNYVKEVFRKRQPILWVKK